MNKSKHPKKIDKTKGSTSHECSKESVSDVGKIRKKKSGKITNKPSSSNKNTNFISANYKTKLQSKSLSKDLKSDEKSSIKKRKKPYEKSVLKSFKIPKTKQVSKSAEKLSSLTKAFEKPQTSSQKRCLISSNIPMKKKMISKSNLTRRCDDVEMLDISANISEENSAHLSTSVASFYIVVDTNIFLDKNELKTIQSLIDWHPLPGKTFQKALVVVPWVVLQELDHLKSKDETGKNARRAIKFLNQNFSKKSRIRGQSILEAATVIEGLTVENNDDRLLQCCFFYYSSPEKHKTVLFSKDSNLCNKAMINHIETFSSFPSLVKYITRACKTGQVDLDDDKLCLSTNSSSSASVKPPLRHLTESVDDDDSENNNKDYYDFESILDTVKESAEKALSYIIKEEFIIAFGKDLWLDCVKRKPPWNLFGIFYCIKKHWFAVFEMAGYDKIALHLVESLMERMNIHSIKDNFDQSFIASIIELVKILSKKYKKVEVVKSALKIIQECQRKVKKSSAAGSSGGEIKESSSKASNDYNPPNLDQYDVDFDEIIEDDEKDFSEEQCTVFWGSIDQVWTCIIEHCASIISSLKWIPTSIEIPPELKTLLTHPSSIEVPTLNQTIQVLPLFNDLLTNFINSLNIFLSSYEVHSSPSLSSSYDFIQTLWTIIRAFNLHNNLIIVKPFAVSHTCAIPEQRTSLVTGFNKLHVVYEILQQCALYVKRMT